MTSYLITYDLLKPTKDYSRLYSGIRAIDAGAWHGLESVWIVQSQLSAAAIRDYLAGCIDANDRVLVTAVAKEWAGLRLPDTANLARITETLLRA